MRDNTPADEGRPRLPPHGRAVRLNAAGGADGSAMAAESVTRRRLRSVLRLVAIVVAVTIWTAFLGRIVLHVFAGPTLPSDPELERCVRDPRGDVRVLIECLEGWERERDQPLPASR